MTTVIMDITHTSGYEAVLFYAAHIRRVHGYCLARFTAKMHDGRIVSVSRKRLRRDLAVAATRAAARKAFR